MQLGLVNTFTRNFSKAAITDGDYHNIRMLTHPQTSRKDGQEQWIVPPHLPAMAPNGTLLPGPEWPNVADSSVWAMADARVPMTSRHGGPAIDPKKYPWVIDNFAAACWNTAQQLTDILYTYNTSDGSGREAFVPIGLIESAWGGTMIEAWTPNATLTSSCKNAVGGPPAVAPGGNGCLFNGMVAPFLNMTIWGG